MLCHPPHLVRQEHRGEGARYEPSVVRADDGVEQDLNDRRDTDRSHLDLSIVPA